MGTAYEDFAVSQCRAADGFGPARYPLMKCRHIPVPAATVGTIDDDDEALVSDTGVKSILLAAGQSTSVVDLLHVRRECH